MTTRTTKRRILAQILVCSGCCCGRTDKGKPPVPLDWLKSEWKLRKMKPAIQLTISGCLGPCDLVNVVGIVTGEKQIWLGGIDQQAHYESLMDWATDCMVTNKVLPLPTLLAECVFERFQPASSE